MLSVKNSLKCKISGNNWMMKFIFGIQINTKVSASWYCKSLHIFAISFKKHGRWNWFFCLQINTNVFSKIIVSRWVYVACYAQNNKFALSLLSLKENIKNEGDFLPADKRQRFHQTDTTNLVVLVQACLNYSK